MHRLNDLTEQSVIGWGNRGWIEIIETILETCEKGSLKTHIMYKCNLNSKQIRQYIHFLLNHRLIEDLSSSPSSSRVTYKTTESGKKYINAYKQLKDVFS